MCWPIEKLWRWFYVRGNSCDLKVVNRDTLCVLNGVHKIQVSLHAWHWLWRVVEKYFFRALHNSCHLFLHFVLSTAHPEGVPNFWYKPVFVFYLIIESRWDQVLANYWSLSVVAWPLKMIAVNTTLKKMNWTTCMKAMQKTAAKNSWNILSRLHLRMESSAVSVH